MKEIISYNTLRKIKSNLEPEIYENLVNYLASEFRFVELVYKNPEINV